MNERIKELAEQAAQEVRVEHNNAYWRMQDEIKEDSMWREKFAELIVRECLSVIQNNLDSEDCTEFTICGFKEDMRTIKEHFGVE